MSETGIAARQADPRKVGHDFIAGLVIFIVALYVLVESIRMPFYSGSSWMGSPGLTPGLIAFFLILLSAGLMLRSRAVRFGALKPRITVEVWRALAAFLIILVYVAAVPWIGYVAATFVMLAVFQFVFTRRRGIKDILVWVVGLSALLTFALWYLFQQIFLLPMP